jgi:hypothetical protein
MKDKLINCKVCNKEMLLSETLHKRKGPYHKIGLCSEDCVKQHNNGYKLLHCRICNTQLKKKDSLMQGVLVCSKSCKAAYKAARPKHLGLLTIEYWLKQGLTTYRVLDG